MKKIIAGTLLLAIAFTATACHKDTPEMVEVEVTTEAVETTEETTVATTEKATVTTTAEVTAKKTTAAKTKKTTKKATKANPQRKTGTTTAATKQRKTTNIKTERKRNMVVEDHVKSRETVTNYWQKNNPPGE